jgi:hypothetical protein
MSRSKMRKTKWKISLNEHKRVQLTIDMNPLEDKLMQTILFPLQQKQQHLI